MADIFSDTVLKSYSSRISIVSVQVNVYGTKTNSRRGQTVTIRFFKLIFISIFPDWTKPLLFPGLQ